MILNITDVKIRTVYPDGRLQTLVSVTLNGEFAIHDIKVISGEERFFIAMPSRRDSKGEFHDICHPIHAAARQELENAVLAAYREYLDNIKAFGEF